MVARCATVTLAAWAALAAPRDPLSSPSHATGEGLSRMGARGGRAAARGAVQPMRARGLS